MRVRPTVDSLRMRLAVSLILMCMHAPSYAVAMLISASAQVLTVYHYNGRFVVVVHLYTVLNEVQHRGRINVIPANAQGVQMQVMMR